MRTLPRRSLFLFAILLLSLTGWTQVTSRESVGAGAAQADGRSYGASTSANGRYVVFFSQATNLVPGDTNGCEDVFVRDRLSGTTERISVDSSGVQGNGASVGPAITPDGRFVVFESEATNLVPGDTNGLRDIFRHDRQSGTTELVSVATGGAQADRPSSSSSISANGQYVAFLSPATNLVAGDTNGVGDVFLRDIGAGTTTRVSVAWDGTQANYTSSQSWISANGLYVAFSSLANNLVIGDTNVYGDVFVRDLGNATTERVDVATGGGQANYGGSTPAISADGRFIAFQSGATNLVAGDTNAAFDVFVHDRWSGGTERVSVATGGAEGNDRSRVPWISGDGRFVAFESDATNLVAGDTNGTSDVFLHDRAFGTTTRESVATGGAQGDSSSYWAFVSGDGRFVAFQGEATNLVAGDTNGLTDVFLRDREAWSSTSLCDPGTNGVIACPCSNQPAGPGRGCDNSSATGGASLAVSGSAYLSVDSLVFTTNGEKPTATSILLQGSTLAANGVVYGQGVRCVGGTLKRLFSKHAVAGSITAPDFGAGDPSVSARSTALGDVIQPLQSRWYLVYYRDPIVLGGCPGGSTFNATQTQLLTWWP